MKSSVIKQLIENSMRQENLNNNDQSIKKLPTQSNQMKKKIKYQNEKNIKNPSITRRKPRVYVPNRKYFDPNRRKLKSFSRSKKNNNNKINKFKFLITNKKTNHMNNRTICTDGYDNMIISSNAHDRNLSAPSLNYQSKEDLYTNYNKNYLKKKKKNNIIKFNRLNKKINENLINRDNYTNPIELNFNSVKENNTNITVNDDKISYITYNNNNDIHQINLDKSKIKGDLSSSVKTRFNNDQTIEDKYNKYNTNNNNNSINIKNFYKNINKKKQNQSQNNDYSDFEISIFNKDIEKIRNTRESIAFLKEQLRIQDNNYRTNNIYKSKLNSTMNDTNLTNINQQNDTKKSKSKNKINLVKKNGYIISNFHNYNQNIVSKKNKSKNYINKINNTYLNDTSSMSKETYPNKQISSTNRGNNNNINLSNSSNNKTITTSTNMTNNHNSFGKKINLSNVYGGPNENNNSSHQNTDNIKAENSNINNNNNAVDINSYTNEGLNKVNNNKNDDLLINNKNNNIEKPKKQSQNQNKDINYLSKGNNALSLCQKNKNEKYKNKEQNINNKKKLNSKKNYSNNVYDINFLSNKLTSIYNERNNNFNRNFHTNRNISNNKNNISYDIVKNKKSNISKIKLAKVSKSKEKIKNSILNMNKDTNLKKKNSCKPYINKNRSTNKKGYENENISTNKVKKHLSKSNVKSKSIYKIGVVCKAGEIVFGETKTNQDNYFNYLINDDTRFIGVCDGHGEYGHHVSKYLRNHLPLELEKDYKSLTKNDNVFKNSLEKEMSGYYNINLDKNLITNSTSSNNGENILEKIKIIFENSFDRTDKNLSSFCQELKGKINNIKENSSEDESNESIFDVEYSGSTCVSIFLKQKNINKIYIANVGDSRAIIIKENENKNWVPYQLSRDHKPTEEDEVKRILEYDGEIERIEDDDGNWTGPLRVWMKGSDGPGLAMTRSFGDEIGSLVGVLPIPEVGEYQIKEEDRAIIIASDGLWEYMTNEEVADIVKKLISKKDPDYIANELYKESIIKWKLKDYGIDDITIICILLKTS